MHMLHFDTLQLPIWAKKSEMCNLQKILIGIFVVDLYWFRPVIAESYGKFWDNLHSLSKLSLCHSVASSSKAIHVCTTLFRTINFSGKMECIRKTTGFLLGLCPVSIFMGFSQISSALYYSGWVYWQSNVVLDYAYFIFWGVIYFISVLILSKLFILWRLCIM